MGDRQKQDERRICVATLGGAHGVRGDIRLRPFTDDPHTLERYDALFLGETTKTVSVRLLRPLKGGWAARMTGVETREDAERLKGTALYVTRPALDIGHEADDDPDSFFLADLVGLTVVSPDGRDIGRIVGVPNFGAGDLLDLSLHEAVAGFGKSVLLPFARRFAPEIDLESGTITVDLKAWTDIETGNEAKPERKTDDRDGET